MTVLTYSEGPGRTLRHASMLVTVEGEPSNIVAEVVARLNADRTPRERGWWSPMTWTNDHRTAMNWVSGCGFAGDLDWGHYEVTTSATGKQTRKFVKAPLPAEVAQAIESEAKAGKLSGNAFHLSPHGVRTVGILAEQCHDRVAFQTGAEVYEDDLARWLAGHPEWAPGDGENANRRRLAVAASVGVFQSKRSRRPRRAEDHCVGLSAFGIDIDGKSLADLVPGATTVEEVIPEVVRRLEEAGIPPHALVRSGRALYVHIRRAGHLRGQRRTNQGEGHLVPPDALSAEPPTASTCRPCSGCRGP